MKQSCREPTRCKVDLLGYQCPPLNHVPDLLQFEYPENSDDDENYASEKGQAQDVRSKSPYVQRRKSRCHDLEVITGCAFRPLASRFYAWCLEMSKHASSTAHGELMKPS